VLAWIFRAHAQHRALTPPYPILTTLSGYALPNMPPNSFRIAQTTTEVKNQHKKNGPQIPAHQLKQLERGLELDERAARLRDKEESRKAAKKRREDKEEKEKAARKQTGVGLATQLIGYSHTQAQLKNGMEAFLGVKRRKDEEKRKHDLELTKKLEAIAQEVEKEPWDDDEDEADDIALDLPMMRPSVPEPYVDDDLDDDTLLEAHDLVMSDPIEVPSKDAQQPPPPPLPRAITPQPKQVPVKDDLDFTRLHGPLNKMIESILDQLPESLVELLSMDISMKLPDWDPAPGLLHKLNPVGLPPHRLRLKVGGVVTLLRDLNTSSQLSKSQHLRVLRIENERLECLVLDGQLEGTKAVLTRVKFAAKYRNDDRYPFQRTQFPVRLATNFTPAKSFRDTSQTGFKLPLVPSLVRSASATKKPIHVPKIVKPPLDKNPGFKLPGLPASKAAPHDAIRPSFIAPAAIVAALISDGWDDFLDSGTQIARELSNEVLPVPAVVTASSRVESLPPLSTQDFDFIMEDLEDVSSPARIEPPIVELSKGPTDSKALSVLSKPVVRQSLAADNIPRNPPALPPRTAVTDKVARPVKSKTRPRQSNQANPPFDFSTLTPSQKPRSIPAYPAIKRKGFVTTTEVQQPPSKRPRIQAAQPPAAPKPPAMQPSLSTFDDFCFSTQDAASFFDDDDDLMFGSPPITV
jgi:hypothetical protein